MKSNDEKMEVKTIDHLRQKAKSHFSFFKDKIYFDLFF